MQQKSELPEGWTCTKLEILAELITGSTPSRKVSEYFRDIPWVKISGDLNDGLITDTEEKMYHKMD